MRNYFIKLDLRHAEIDWQLYSCLANTMMENTLYVERIYFDESFSKYIIVQENRFQLSQGSTGLSCWQVLYTFNFGIFV